MSDFKVRPELDDLIAEFRDACQRVDVQEATRIIEAVSAWSKDGSATNAEAAAWLETLKLALRRPCGDAIPAIIYSSMDEWMVFLRGSVR